MPPTPYPLPGHPSPAADGEDSFRATAVAEVANPEAAWPATGCTTPTMASYWYLRCCRRTDMPHPGRIRHIIVSAATPVEEGRPHLVRPLFRNDMEEACPTETLIARDAAIVRGDKAILERTGPDVVLDQTLRAERLLELLEAHGTAEATNAEPAREGAARLTPARPRRQDRRGGDASWPIRAAC